jgi:hypothetical protein
MGPMSCRTRSELAARAAHHGIAFSQYVSDILALAVGLPELARELNQATLALTEATTNTRGVEPPVWGTPRVPLPVYNLIREISSARQITAAQFVSEVCDAHVEGRPLPDITIEGELLMMA